MTDTQNTQNTSTSSSSTSTDKELTRSQRTNARRRARSEQQIKEDQRRLRPTGEKQCPKCHKIKTLGHFTRDIYRADGLMTVCGACWAVVRKG